jgi:parallel beta-helix repeat protein
MPLTPGSRKLVLAGESGLKKGPAVSSGVSFNGSPTAGVGARTSCPFSPQIARARRRKARGAAEAAKAPINFRLEKARRLEPAMNEDALTGKKLQGTLEDNEIFANAFRSVEINTGGNPTLRKNRISKNEYEAI